MNYEIDAGGLSPTVDLPPAEIVGRIIRRAILAAQARQLRLENTTLFLPYLKRFCYNKVTDNGPNLREKTR